MSEQNITTAASEEKAVSVSRAESKWKLTWPAISTILVLFFFGIIGGLVAIAVYYWIKPRAGTALATIAGGLCGLMLAVGFTMMLH